jgi:hypothetical protein
MFNLNLTPFSTMTWKKSLKIIACGELEKINIPCETVWISVVCLTGSSDTKRPLESMRWEAKMVLISVDFPSPVGPNHKRTMRN